MKTSQTGFGHRLLPLLLSLLLAACGGNPGGGGPTSGTVNTPGGQVQVALQGGSFTQGPTAVQVNAPGFQTPYGGIGFTAQVPQAGGTLTVTLTFPQDLPQGAVLLKCLSGNCTPIQEAQLQGRIATFQVRDGGPWDADGQANGRVVDPVALGVPIPPDFTLSLSPTSLTVEQGGSGSTTLTLTPQNGFTGQVVLSLEGQDGSPAPQGITLSPNSVNVTGANPVTQTLTLTVGQGVAPGSYALRVRASSGSLSKTANLSLTVQAPPPPPDFTLSLSPTSLTVEQGGSGSTTLTLTPQNGFTGQVALSLEGQDGSPAPQGITLSPNSVNVTGADPVTQALTLTVGQGVAPGSYSLRVRASSGSLSKTANLNLTVQAPPPPPDFTLSLSPTSLTVEQGGSGSTTLTLTPQNGFTGQVALSLEGQDGSPAPQGITLSPNSVNVTGADPVTQTLTLTVGQGVAPGSYSLRVRGVSGNLARWVDLSLTVTQVEPQGVLDETFGSGGKVLLDLEPGNAYYASRIALLVQPDGKIIMGGARADVTTNPNVLHTSVVRFHPDGTLDTSFGNGGMFLAHYSLDFHHDHWGGADLTPDGGVVLAVKASRRPNPNNCPSQISSDILVVKLSGSGQPLWTQRYNLLVDDYGTPNNPCDDVYSGFEPAFVRVGPDGKILIGGWNNSGYVGFDEFGAFLLRLNPDGTPDASFGSGGKVLVPRTSAAAYYAATFLPDGRIVVGGTVVNGSNGNDLLVARYHPDGTLDTSFGTGGFTVLNPGNTNEIVWDIKLQPDGKLVLAIAVGSIRTGVCRLNPDGSLDQGFHCGVVHQGSGAGSMGALALQPNGKVLLVAMNFYAFYVYRLAAADGSQEASWSFGFGGPEARGYGIAYLPDHKILVGGWASNGSFWDFALVRLR